MVQVHQATVLEPREPEGDVRRPPRPPDVPRGLVTASELGWRFLVVVAAVAVLAYALWYVRLVALPAFIALLIATLLVPPVAALVRRGVSRGLATTIVFVTALLVVFGLASLVVPPFISELGVLADTVAGGAQELGRLVASGPFGITEAEVQRAVDSASQRLQASSGQIASGVLSGAMIFGQIVASALLTAVLVFFFVKDGAWLWSWIVRLFPRRIRARVDQAGDTGWSVLSAYVRGVVLVATIDAVFIGIGMTLVGMPLVLPLAVLTFVAAFVPIIGAVVAGSAAVLIALVSNGVGAALVVLGIVLLVQQLEGNVLYPLIMRRTMEMHPVATLMAVGAGGVLAGIIGALVAIPITAVVATTIPILRGTSPPDALDPED
jgi:predicted PurR-regulated permease PerM